MEKRYCINDDVSDATLTTTASSAATHSVSRSLYRERREREKRNKPRRRYPVRQLKSRGAVQVLVWNLLVFSYHNTAILHILRFFNLNEPWKDILAVIFLQEVLPKLFYPVAGWIADAKVGRYKVIRMSLFLLWIGSVVHLLISWLKYSVIYSTDLGPDALKLRYNIMFYITLPFTIIIYALNAVGNAGFHANIIPFGLDQMEDGSAEQHSAFIHWYYWTRNVSFGTLVYLLIHTNSDYCKAAFAFGPNSDSSVKSKEPLYRFDLCLLFFECTFLAAALCMDFIFSPKYLNKDPKTHYPIRRIWRISNFVRENNQLVGRRKAITFTYDAPPDRWDFAKRLYGGPFEGEDVEDVRTFWRVLGFIFSVGLGAIVIIYQGYYLYGPYAKHMKLPLILHQCISEFAVSALSTNFTILLVIPIYEFVIYPFFRKYILRILRRIGLGMALALTGTTVLLLMDFFGHKSSTNEHCLLFRTIFDDKMNADNPSPLDFTPGYLIPAIFIVSLGEMLTFIPIFEFICAQSPFSMRGMLIGLFYAIQAIFVALIGLVVGIVAAVFRYHTENLLSGLSCGSWYLITIIGIGIAGFLVYLIAAKCYKKRERGGYQVNEQTVLEGYYEPRDDDDDDNEK